jgi:hypothetical protein
VSAETREAALRLATVAQRVLDGARTHLGRPLADALSEAADDMEFETEGAREIWVADFARALELQELMLLDDLPALRSWEGNDGKSGGTDWPPNGVQVSDWADDRLTRLQNLLEALPRELPPGRTRDAWLAAIAEAGESLRQSLGAERSSDAVASQALHVEGLAMRAEETTKLVSALVRRLLASIGETLVPVKLHEMKSDDPTVRALRNVSPYAPLLDTRAVIIEPGTLVRVGKLVRKSTGNALVGVVYYA